jgi:histidine triad (HIT) family protein
MSAETKDDCIFCKIAAGAIPAKFLYEDEDVVAFPDVSPKAPFHALVIPREHRVSLFDYGDGADGDGARLGALLRGAVRVARDAGFDEEGRGFRLVVNTGPQGGQSVFHVHLHVLGGRALSWPPG